MSATTTTTIAVGTPATEYIGSDSYPCIVVGINPSGTKIVVQRAKYGLAPGVSGFDCWATSDNGQLLLDGPDEGRQPSVYTMRRNGRWVLQGQDMKTGRSISLGTAVYHRDPSF